MKHTPTLLMQFVLLFVAVASPVHACPQSPGYGFIIHSRFIDQTRALTVISNQVEQSLHGDWVSDDSGARGLYGSFDGVTDGNGNLAEYGKRTPAVWRITHVTGYCSQYDPLHPSILPNYQEIHFQPSSAPQDLTCRRYAVALNVNVYSDTWVNVSYSHGSVSDIPDGGGSPPNETPTPADWGSGQLYESATMTFVENIPATNVTSNSADFDPYGGHPYTTYILVVFDTSGNSCGTVGFNLP